MSAELWVATGGFVVAVVGVAVAVWAVQVQRRPKQLDYMVISCAGLLKPAAQKMRDPLRIAYDDVTMQAPWLTTVRVVNTGKQAITSAEYVEPIEVMYEQNPPLHGYVTSASRDGLWPPDQSIWPEIDDLSDKCSSPPTRHALRPTLLNPGEWFEVQLLSDGPPGRLSVNSVFPEQSRPMQLLKPKPSYLWKARVIRIQAAMIVILNVAFFVAVLIRRTSVTFTGFAIIVGGFTFTVSMLVVLLMSTMGLLRKVS